MTYQEAKKIALSIDEEMDTCHEYETAYAFSCSKGEVTYDDRIVVVIKETGEAVNWIQFIMDFEHEQFPLILDFETGEAIGRMKDEEYEEDE